MVLSLPSDFAVANLDNQTARRPKQHGFTNGARHG